MKQRHFNRPFINGRIVPAQPSLEELMSTREALREMSDAYPHRFTSSEVYRTCRADLERTLKDCGWPTAKVQAEVDDAIQHGLCPEMAATLRR